MKQPPREIAEWVTIARLLRTRGRRGELSAESLSSHPERFQQLGEVRLHDAEGFPKQSRILRVTEVWQHQDRLIFKFEGVDSISDAEALKGAEVQVPHAERFALPDDEYYHSDLVGCRIVERENDRPVGVVHEFLDLGAHGLLRVIADDGHEVLIPFNKSICVEIDLANKEITVDLPEGLTDLNAP